MGCITLKTGDLVEATDFDGRKLLRKAVEIYGETVYICAPEEYELATKLGQEPLCVGFNKEFVRLFLPLGQATPKRTSATTRCENNG